jgi:hypothetical protein
MVGIILMKFNSGEFHFQETVSTHLNGRNHGTEGCTVLFNLQN